MENYNEHIAWRMWKAFSEEIDREEICKILTKSYTYGDAFEECIRRAETVPANRYYVIITQLKDGYPCEKLEFSSRSDMIVFYDGTVKYFKDHISTYGHIDVCMLKNYFKEQNPHLYADSHLYERLSDVIYGWKNIMSMRTYPCRHTKILYFDDPVKL